MSRSAGAISYSSPVIGTDGTIYIGSSDYYLYAVNPFGSLKWRYQTGRRYILYLILYKCIFVLFDILIQNMLTLINNWSILIEHQQLHLIGIQFQL